MADGTWLARGPLKIRLSIRFDGSGRASRRAGGPCRAYHLRDPHGSAPPFAPMTAVRPSPRAAGPPGFSAAASARACDAPSGLPRASSRPPPAGPASTRRRAGAGTRSRAPPCWWARAPARADVAEGARDARVLKVACEDGGGVGVEQERVGRAAVRVLEGRDEAVREREEALVPHRCSLRRRADVCRPRDCVQPPREHVEGGFCSSTDLPSR